MAQLLSDCATLNPSRLASRLVWSRSSSLISKAAGVSTGGETDQALRHQKWGRIAGSAGYAQLLRLLLTVVAGRGDDTSCRPHSGTAIDLSGGAQGWSRFT